MLACLAIFFQPEKVFAFGLSPGRIYLKNVFNSSRVKQTINITRGNPAADETLSITPNGEASKYLEFTEKTIFLPKGQTLVPFSFYVAPKSAPNGTYRVELDFMGVKNGLGNAAASLGSTVSVGATMTVSFVVNDKQERIGEIRDLRVDPIEGGEETLLPLTVRVKNTGNIDLIPDKAIVQISNKTGLILEKTITDFGDFPLVPNAADEFRGFGIPVKLDIGKYAISVVFYLGDKALPKLDTSFDVLKPGSLTQKIVFSSFVSAAKELKQAGIPVQLDAVFENTGDGVYEASVFVEVKEDKDVVDTFQIPKKYIRPYTTTRFTQIFTPKSTGTFTLTAFGDTGVIRSTTKEIVIKVGTGRMFVLIIMGVVLLILAIGISIYLKKRKNNGINKLI